jgi:hypothetical protein
MDRANLTLAPNNLSFDYNETTKIVTIKYKKPSQILEREERDRLERKNMGTKEPTDANCNQQ